MTLQLLPDAEQGMVRYLLNSPDLTALVGERVWTIMPNAAKRDETKDFIVLTRIGGSSRWVRPHYLDDAQIQIDCYGPTKRRARNVMDTVRALMPDLIGAAIPGGYCMNITFGLVGWQPDTDFSKALSRYLVEVTMTNRPSGSP